MLFKDNAVLLHQKSNNANNTLVSMKKNLVLIVLSAVALQGCQRTENQPQTKPKVKVGVMAASTDTNRLAARYSGTVETESGSILSFPVSGTIRTLNIHLGQRVAAGQQIATLDPTTMQSAYQAAKAALNQAEDAYGRMKKLHDKGSLSDIKWVEVQSQLEQARAMENMAAKNLHDCKLYAPFDGVIAEKCVEVGQNVMPGTPIARLVTDARLNVKIAVPETEIAAIAIRQNANIKVAALGGKTLSGTVTEKGIVANPLSRSYEVKIRVGSGHPELKPGMVAEVFLSPTKQDTLAPFVVPAHIVQLDEHNNSFVWVVENGRASKRIVRCGTFTAAGVTVISGLKADDSIIIEGQQKISEGTEVTL